MKKKLAIICAGESQKPLVLKAKEMGIETHCFAWDKEKHNVCKGIADYYHPISVMEKEQILEVCKEIEIDGVTTVVTSYAVPTVCYVAEKLGLTGNRYEDALVVGNKYLARQAYIKNGVKSPRFAVVQDGIEPDLTGFKYPLIVKPTDRNSTIGVSKVNNKEELRETIQRSLQFSFIKQALIEEYIEGFEVSLDTISWKGKHYILVIKEREMTAGVNCNVKIAGHWPADLPSEIQEKLKTETRKALDAINFKYGASNTEFKITPEGEVFIIETNPRMAGDRSDILMKAYNGYDMLKGVIDVALGQFEEPVITETKYSGIYLLTKQTEWVRRVIENWKNNPDIVYAEMSNEQLPELQWAGSRTGFFIYQSNQKRRWGAPSK